jgi:catalase
VVTSTTATQKPKNSDRENGGPFLLEDQISREKLHRFDHESIPERVVHARGFRAHGHFEYTMIVFQNTRSHSS